MIKACNYIIGAVFALCATAVFSAPASTVYDFTSDAYAPTQVIPGVELSGLVSGKLTTRFSEQTGMYSIDSMIVDFDKMPRIVATNFTRLNDNEYVAHIRSVWIYRSIKLVVHSPEGFYSPRSIDVRVSVDYSESYVGDHGVIGDEGHFLADFYTELKPRTTFSTIDTYKTTFEGKAVYIKLNKNLSRSSDLFSMYPNEGIEIKVTWYGHGEGSYFFPHPLTENISPFAIASDKEMLSEGEAESIFVKFKNGAGAMDTSPVPLEILLHEAIQ